MAMMDIRKVRVFMGYRHMLVKMLNQSYCCADERRGCKVNAGSGRAQAAQRQHEHHQAYSVAEQPYQHGCQ